MTAIREGDLVQVVTPHPEAGARGRITNLYRANADYERRARVAIPLQPRGERGVIVPTKYLRVIR